VSSRQPRASGYFRTSYGQEQSLLQTRTEKLAASIATLTLLAFPLFATPFQLDLACQAFLASVGAISLMLLTGYAGQVSLGHAGLIAAGAFTAGILYREVGAPIWITLPAAAVMGALLGLIFGIPSLRLRGLYLAISTLALHFVVLYLGGEYESRRGFSTGIVIDPPMLWGWTIRGNLTWYFILLTAAALTLFLSLNLLRSKTGRAWQAVRAHETVAGAFGIDVRRAKLTAFVISSAMTAVAGALFAHWRGFVSVEAFSLFLSIQYVAMIIIGGMGSLLGAILGAVFVTLFPYAIESGLRLLSGRVDTSIIFSVNHAAFGLVMILFLVFEPLGLVGIYRRIQTYFLLWPFKQKPLGGPRR
jgi:branched-chain amino acid transport system permease protein